MELAGKLDHYDFADLLQMLASSGKSGKLTLTEYGGQGVVVLRQGKIIYAASSSAREALGNMLVCQGLVTEEQLTEGLAAQRERDDERRLGTILVELGFLEQEALESVVAAQIQRVIPEFMDWHVGFFRFEEFELPDRGEVEVDARLLHGGTGAQLLTEGLPANQLLLRLASKMDAAGTEEGVDEPADDGDEAFADPLAELEIEPSSSEKPGRLASLRSIMAEFHSPAFTGESTLMILNYAQRLVRRGVLFSMTAAGATGLGQYGFEPPEGAPPDFIRQLTIPADDPSIITEVMARKSSYRGPLEDIPTNRLLLEKLGGGWPSAAVAAPLLVGGRTLMIFYGDNLPEDDPIGAADELEIVLIHASLAIEKSLLANKLEHLEDLQRRADRA